MYALIEEVRACLHQADIVPNSPKGEGRSLRCIPYNPRCPEPRATVSLARFAHAAVILLHNIGFAALLPPAWRIRR